MRVLLDQGMPRSLASLLREAGLDTVHTAEIGLAQATDKTILERALEDDRIVITFDADFHSLLALSGKRRPSVVRVRMEGLRAEELDRILQNVMKQCRTELETGAMVSVQEDRIRVRSLPII